MKTISPIAFTLILGFSLAFVGGCGKGENGENGGGGSSTGVIKIGFAGPLSAGDKEFGLQAQKGAQLLIDLVNSAGGIKGRKLELVVKDDQSQPDVAAQMAQTLATDPAVVAVAGHLNSRCTIQGREVYNGENALTQITYGSTKVDICKGKKYTFRNIYRDDAQGAALADFVKEKLNKTKVACAYEDDAYGKGLFQEFDKQCKAIGLEMVYSNTYATDSGTDYKTTLQALEGKGAEVILLSGTNKTAAVAAELRKINKDIQILSGDGSFLEAFIATAGPAAEGAIISGPGSYAHTGSEDAKKFAEDFRKKFKEEPSAWASQAYDAVGIIVAAVKAVGTDRDKIRDYVAGINSREKAFKGVSGDTYFDSEGDPIDKPVYFYKVVNQKFVAYQ